MPYFKDAKVGDEVYGMIFGKGIVSEVLPDSHYSIIVNFDNSHQVPYTEEGIPSWGNFDEQTMYYRKDIDLTNEDFSPVQEILEPAQIIRLRSTDKLEVRCPSGAWRAIGKADTDYAEDLLEQKQFHLFRQK